MIKVFKKDAIPKSMELISLNDLFFNKVTVDLLDKKAKQVIEHIDDSEMISQYMIKCRFDGSVLNIDKLC